jgi:hypothetical protein
MVTYPYLPSSCGAVCHVPSTGSANAARLLQNTRAAAKTVFIGSSHVALAVMMLF